MELLVFSRMGKSKMCVYHIINVMLIALKDSAIFLRNCGGLNKHSIEMSVEIIKISFLGYN